MNNVLFRRGDQTFIDNNVPLNDGQIIFNETDEAIYLDNTIGGSVVRKRYGGGNLSRSDIDMALSTTSENPIANKVVTNAIGNLPSLQTNVKTNLVGAINEVNTKLSKTEDLIGIVENGNTCTHTGGIIKGQYVIWKGNLYTADSNISVGTTFASSGGSKNLTAVTDGGLNKLANQYLGSFTVSGLESYLLTILTNMSYDEKKYVSFVISTPSGVFRNAVYQGIFTKTNNSKYEIIVWADDRIEYIIGAYYANVMHWDKMAKDSNCAKMAYIEPTFTNGSATYNMASILSNYGYSSLTSVVAQVEGRGYVTGVYIAKSSISQNTNIELTLATTSYSGVIGVTVIFKGN